MKVLSFPAVVTAKSLRNCGLILRCAAMFVLALLGFESRGAGARSQTIGASAVGFGFQAAINLLCGLVA